MSRESELYKDKIEVSLDGRQIFYLFFGGATIVGLVFVLGVLVGRRVEARGHVDRVPGAATIDPLAALDRLEGGPTLSFQGSLRGGEVPANDVEKTIAAMQKHDDRKKPEPRLEPKLEPKPEAKPNPKPEPKLAEPSKLVDKKPETKAEDKKPEAKAETKAEDKKPDAKSEDKKPDAKSEDKKPETKNDDKPKFTLQLSSFQDRAEAQAFADSVKSAGYQGYVTEGAVDGKQYFRVRTGSYRTVDAANAARTDLEKATKRSAIVIKL